MKRKTADECVRQQLATKRDDMWKHRKTGKLVRVVRVLGVNRVRLEHQESGREVVRELSTLAREYDLVKP